MPHFESKLRHLPFFEEVTRHDEGDAGWRAATAGLVVLRLVDAWIEDGPHVADSDDWPIRSVRLAIGDLESQNQVARLLSSIVDALVPTAVVDMRMLAPRLMAYGQFLEYEAKWTLACDVYESIIAHTHPVLEMDSATHAHLRRGYCLRQMGDLTSSVAAYQTAGQIAQAANDMVGILRARIGEAKAAISRGNMPHAQTILEETIARARDHHLTDVHSMALHDRAIVAHLTGEYELAIRFAYEALETTQSPRERDRILGDIATSFYRLGVRTAARDAYLILAATAQEQYERWLATLNLMEIAADEGQQVPFETYRRSIVPDALPPRLRVTYWLTAGIGYDRFGEPGQAKHYLATALAVAEENELNQMAFEVQTALQSIGLGSRVALSPIETTLRDNAVDEIARTLKGTRELLRL